MISRFIRYDLSQDRERWKSHTFKDMMVHVPLMFLSEWREFPSAPCLAKKTKFKDSSRLDVVEIARVA